MIYLSYVLGTNAERENLTILPLNEIKKRLVQMKTNASGFLKVTEAENKADYDQFKLNILEMYNN